MACLWCLRVSALPSGWGTAEAAVAAADESLQLILQQGQRGKKRRGGLVRGEGRRERRQRRVKTLKVTPVTLLLQQGHNLLILPQQSTTRETNIPIHEPIGVFTLTLPQEENLDAS